MRGAGTGVRDAGATIADYDRDSIHTLPLSILPIRHPALSRARLIRNHRLEPRIELYREAGGGSGQIGIEEVPDFFPSDEATLAQDLGLLRKLGALPAFDPYTLRIGLREAGVDVLRLDALQLSPGKRAELQPLMRSITRPLVTHLYGRERAGELGVEAIARALANPDTQLVRERIRQMATALQTTTDGLPAMLEDYGDTCLALTYYRSYLDFALPVVDRMTEWMRDVAGSHVLRTDVNVQRSFRQTQALLNSIAKSVSARLGALNAGSVVDWSRVTIDSFRAIRQSVFDSQRSFAEVLCGMTVKIYEWELRFPSGGGSPEKRAEFVIAELMPKLDSLWVAESRAASAAAHQLRPAC